MPLDRIREDSTLDDLGIDSLAGRGDHRRDRSGARPRASSPSVPSARRRAHSGRCGARAVQVSDATVSLTVGELKAMGTSPAAIAEHYDLSDDFFETWLGSDLVYSCALWDPPTRPTPLRWHSSGSSTTSPPRSGRPAPASWTSAAGGAPSSTASSVTTGRREASVSRLSQAQVQRAGRARRCRRRRVPPRAFRQTTSPRGATTRSSASRRPNTLRPTRSTRTRRSPCTAPSSIGARLGCRRTDTSACS